MPFGYYRLTELIIIIVCYYSNSNSNSNMIRNNRMYKRNTSNITFYSLIFYISIFLIYLLLLSLKSYKHLLPYLQDLKRINNSQKFIIMFIHLFYNEELYLCEFTCSKQDLDKFLQEHPEYRLP